jgi:hypothetical protein
MCESPKYEITTRKHRRSTSRLWCTESFFKKRTAKTQAMKVRTDKWDYIKLRLFYTAKERIDI